MDFVIFEFRTLLSGTNHSLAEGQGGLCHESRHLCRKRRTVTLEGDVNSGIRDGVVVVISAVKHHSKKS